MQIRLSVINRNIYPGKVHIISASPLQKVKPCLLVDFQEVLIIPAPRTAHEYLGTLVLYISRRLKYFDIVKARHKLMPCNCL